MPKTTQLKVDVLDGPWRGRSVLVPNPPPHSIDLPVREKDGSVGSMRYRVDKGPHGLFAERYVVPDLSLPTIGWRSWHLAELGEDGTAKQLIITSANGAPWMPRTPLIARCGPERTGEDGQSEPQHPAPAEGCACGIYASRTMRWLRGHGYTLDVFGLVSLWGRSRQHDQGYRYERAYPLALILNDERIAAPNEGGHIFGADLGSDSVDATLAAALARLGFLHDAYGVPVALGAPERGIQIIGRMRDEGLLPTWSLPVLPTDIRIARRT